MCYLYYQGKGVATPQGAVLGTLPQGCRPIREVSSVAAKGLQSNFNGCAGVVIIGTDGKIILNTIEDGTATSRLYFNVVFPVA